MTQSEALVAVSKKQYGGITAAAQKVPVTINTTIMAENLNEIEGIGEAG